jgi:putative ABC transport system permease protein
MSWIGRLTNLFHRDRVIDEIDQEISSHLEEAVTRGRSAEEAGRSFGSTLRLREQSLDIKLLPWLDAIRSDAVFGWRQLNKHRAVTAVAVLSLALAAGATTGAFRLIDAVLLRPLPVSEPDRLRFVATSFVGRDGRPDYRDDFDYPTFRSYATLIGDRAEVMLIGMSSRQDVAFADSAEPERLYRQYLSGNVFGVFGLQPAVGRLITPNDDITPGGHPVAVLSYDYWTRRFGRDPQAVGRTFRIGPRPYEIIGVAPRGFTGTEPGAATDIFVPAVMNVPALTSPGWSWFRIWVRPNIGRSDGEVRQILQSALNEEHRARAAAFPPTTPRQQVDEYLAQQVFLYPAGSGASNAQKDYQRPLLILGTLVALVLLIACGNLASLLTAQAAARSREMAFRVSIGAGRWRLVQLVLVESALLAMMASALGALFSSWSAPLVVKMLAPPENPVRLPLDADWRVIGFGLVLTIAVTLLFGLAPALRASAATPVGALKGTDVRARSRLIHSLIAAQVAFCVLILFVAGLFATTFERLSRRPLGFSHERVLALQTQSRAKNQSPEIWMQVADQLRRIPGVESVAFSGWALMSGNHWTGPVIVAGRPLEPRSPYFLDVSAGFFDTMSIRVLGGRDFRIGDLRPRVENGQRLNGVGIVNEAFARVYFDGQNPVGREVYLQAGTDGTVPLEIVGYVHDASYSNVRDPIRPTVYLPIEHRSGGTFLVRTAGDPMAVAAILRLEVARANANFQVRTVETQSGLVRQHMIRERLLATLSLFFAAVAIVLACVGLYGVLHYSVIQQRREIGIRMALGARLVHIAGRVTARVLGMVCLGLLAGVAAGLASERFLEALLFEVKATDAGSLLWPVAAIIVSAIVAAVFPVARAARIDPARTLREQ